MPQFINSTESLVTNAIDGILRTHDLSVLDGYPHIKVILRRQLDKSKVALISGGGSGHEPAHAGFVGPGLLSAAVCGEDFASPSVEAVLAGIMAVTGDAGCLLIVKNYTGDRLNFGLAAERAKALRKRVEMVVVGDDIAFPMARQSLHWVFMVSLAFQCVEELGRRLLAISKCWLYESGFRVSS